MVELRKRPAPAVAPPPAKKKATTGPKKASKAAPEKSKPAPEAPEAPVEAETAEPAPAQEEKSSSASVKAKASSAAPVAGGAEAKTGNTITLDGFGGEVETHDGEKTTLAKLVDESKAGVVLFTYPKASTPGCTTQACLFRDAHDALTATGLQIYGLSADSPKSNTTFKVKQNLPYPLLCDPKQTLISAIGMKKKPSGTTRGVFVVDKDGKVLAAEAGGPAATVEAVKRIVAEMGGSKSDEGLKKAEERVANDAEAKDGK